jgi:hypothetical protein
MDDLDLFNNNRSRLIKTCYNVFTINKQQESAVQRSGTNGTCEGVSRSFRTDRLERELQMVQLSATRCSCIAILWVSLVSSAAITLCVASQRVFIVVYFVRDTVLKLLDTPSYHLNSELSGNNQNKVNQNQIHPFNATAYFHKGKGKVVPVLSS